MSCESPDRFINICVDGQPVGTGNPLPTSIGGSGSGVVITDVEDGAGDTVMDPVNDAMRVNIVAGGSSNFYGIAPTDAANRDIDAGGVSQEVFAANADRAYLFIQNLSTESLWINFGAAATQASPSIELIAGPTGYIEYGPGGGAVPSGTVNIIGPTIGQSFAAKEATASGGGGGGGGGGSVIVTDIEDGAGDSVMDAANDAIRVNVVAGGAGGGAVTVADGADVALGAQADAAATTDTGTFSLIALFKRLLGKFTTQFPAALVGGRFDVNVGAALPAGTNNIGDVDVVSLPPLPAGTNAIGVVAVSDIEDGTGNSVMDAANDAIRVNIVAGAGSGGTALADESAFTEGTTSLTPIGGVFNDALASDPTAGQAAAVRITSDRALHINLRDATGTEIGTAGAPVRTDPTGTTAQPITDNAGSLTVDAPAATPVPIAITNTADAIVKAGDAVNDAIRVNVVAGGGGGAVTIADGADAALGAQADAAATTDAGTFSLIALFKRLLEKFTTQFPAALTGSGNLKTALLEAIPAGTNNIGDVDVLTLPAGTVAGSASLPAGINNIGDVDVLTLPALPAGTNNIGDVDVLTLPAGTVAGSASLPAGANNIGDVDVLTLPALATGDNTVGRVRITDGTNTASVRDTGASDSLNVAIVDASGNQVTSFGGGTTPKQVSASFTRPADTTAYAAGDAVTNSTTVPVAMTFSGAGRVNGGAGIVLGALLLDSANQTAKGIFELWLFAGSAAPTADNDNAVFTPTDAELANLVAIIPLAANYIGDATAGAGGNAIYESPEMARPFTCDASIDDLFGLVVCRNSYTPVSAEVFTLILRVSQS